jgi:hypothetical protein
LVSDCPTLRTDSSRPSSPRRSDLRSEHAIRQPLRTSITALAIAAIVALAGVGWHYSGEILGPDAPPAKTGQSILGRTDSTITLALTAKARRPGFWAIEWPEGLGRIGPLISLDTDRVTTRFQLLSGAPPDTSSRLAGFARDADPLTWLGVEFENVIVPSRIGPLPAWFVPGSDSTWAIFMHGRAATRAEVLRMLPAYRSLGLPCLIPSYRNDENAPHVAGGTYRFGLTEWLDLEDAVRYARGQGARQVIVVGCSMGGGIVAQYLRRSEIRDLARVAVLDAPALDWNAVIGLAGRQRRMPGFITELGKIAASMRSGIRWEDLDQILHAAEFSTPMLVLHGEVDATVPIELSERFAAVRPDLVTLHRTPGAGHVESANVDPDGYAATISGWLRERGIGSAVEPAVPKIP